MFNEFTNVDIFFSTCYAICALVGSAICVVSGMTAERRSPEQLVHSLVPSAMGWLALGVAAFGMAYIVGDQLPLLASTVVAGNALVGYSNQRSNRKIYRLLKTYGY